MKKSNLHIIQQLKMQPKQGMATSLGDALTAVGKIIDATTDAAAALNSSTERTVAGVGIMRQAIVDLGQKYQDLGKDTRFLSEENADLAKNFGITISQAVKLSTELQKNAKNFGVGGESLRRYTVSLKGLIGQFAAKSGLVADTYGKTFFEANEILQENLQLTGEQANKFSMYAAFQGETATKSLLQQQSIAKAIDTATGTQGNFREILTDIAALSEDVQLQYSKIPGDLALASAKAKALGFNMSDLHKTGKQLLNIESSIGDELEYQLLSGRRLVDTKGQSLTNSYREAVFQRNATKQADTLLTILNQEGETLENNLLAREQMSKLLGMDEASLARALGKKKILEKIGGQELFNLSGQELFDAAKNLGASASDLEELKKQEDVRTTDQKMVAGIDKMVSIMQATMLGDPLAAQQLMKEQEDAILASQQKQIDATTNLANVVSGPALTDFAGGMYTSRRTLSAIPSPTDFITGLAGMKIQTVKLYPDAVVSNGGTGLASGGVIPPGYPNDTYPAMLTSGETVIPAGESPVGNMAAFAAAIVNAINKQTDALTSNSGINGPYWS